MASLSLTPSIPIPPPAPASILAARKAGGDPPEYLRITLSDVLISS